MTTTNPGWIAAARVEEFAGNTVAARKIIRQGCEINPESDDLWIESARLHGKEDAKSILGNIMALYLQLRCHCHFVMKSFGTYQEFVTMPKIYIYIYL